MMRKVIVVGDPPGRIPSASPPGSAAFLMLPFRPTHGSARSSTRWLTSMTPFPELCGKASLWPRTPRKRVSTRTASLATCSMST